MGGRERATARGLRGPALIGFGGWLAWGLATRPHPLSEAWAEALVLFAALVLVPLGFVVTLERSATWLAKSAFARLTQQASCTSVVAARPKRRNSSVLPQTAAADQPTRGEKSDRPVA